ncbi:MAG TPA: hypothetical protein VMD48_12425, partial [Solirubrobacteraceae bacterium]|nr:hypothetical protein [Solirubrobacteraceae bacterium]
MQRNAEWVRREYDLGKWSRTREELQRLLARDPRPEFSEVVHELSQDELGGAEAMVREADAVIDGRRARLPYGTTYGAAMALVADHVGHAVTPSTDAVVELGAGWARHLLRVRAETARRDVRYVAAEFTESGRAAARSIGALDPSLALEVVPFDYHHPRLALGPLGEAVVFTVHSIEQIPVVPRELVQAIAGLADRVT